MTDDMSLRTPKTNPDHDTVGLCFKAWDSKVYFCDSYDPRYGYWMTRVDCPEDRKNDQHSEFRKNVSERAIDRTFHTIHYDFGRYYCLFGPVETEALGPYAGVGRYSPEYLGNQVLNHE